ncbi:DUF4369 domain-containing protein [Phocaeicola sp.]|uniref:DUF4369 domain-containing protein n=1 Tax=Phocaeicola sp. TaxID=2773926 RepID=UPI0023D2A896|nr:DUF4369 domain-containing protein [Phocaeicola sp.]MDE5677445.1 DUF4369 domain-containing protein [Phocaeicola sp.]
MRKLPFFLFTLVVLTSSCGKKNTFTLEGTIKGLPSDTLLVFYQEPNYKLDTIILSKGKFTYTITPDTFTIFSLLLDKEHVLPIYADKGEKVTLSGTADDIEVKGKGENERLANSMRHLRTLENEHNALTAAVDSLIKAYPQSYTNLYLIEKYYVQDTLPDYQHIDQLIKGLSGILKDTPYIIGLQNKLNDKTEPTNQRVSNIACTDKDGKDVNWNSVRGKYILLDFWASWNKESIAEQDSLVTVQKALKKEKFVIISLSLDLDRKEWLAKCGQKDTTQWKQVCDFKAWNNALVKQCGITRIPANLLIGPNKQIIGRNLRGKKLIDKVKQLTEQDREKEKEAEHARKRVHNR